MKYLEVSFGNGQDDLQEKWIIKIPLEDVDFEEFKTAIEECSEEEDDIAVNIIWDWLKTYLNYTWKLKDN
ncbi:hypothetical protein CLI64_29615 (plasmid) [Nostoc sp. CENA543]|uniref:hypothetical protein n=1 Tax=Nostoc sp. CENA543 TaxID=1869241 RepID=UPI000CA2C2D1|nr:hypothetical protein [Nostoc sp. CENA543]AUT04599.1 hypothetical protein CLI64_29615 [Nostoc sp. CENA543]